jgi:hypothetical protein
MMDFYWHNVFKSVYVFKGDYVIKVVSGVVGWCWLIFGAWRQCVLILM